MSSTNGHGAEPERVALYLRVSSEEQRDRETIKLQRDFLEQYCNLHELEVTDVYEDNGVLAPSRCMRGPKADGS